MDRTKKNQIIDNFVEYVIREGISVVGWGEYYDHDQVAIDAYIRDRDHQLVNIILNPLDNPKDQSAIIDMIDLLHYRIQREMTITTEDAEMVISEIDDLDISEIAIRVR